MKSLAEHLGIEPLLPKDEPEQHRDEAFNAEMTDRDFCRGILMSKTYRESIQRRILIDDLPSAVELMLYDRAFGTRKDQLEVTKKESPVSDWSDDDLVQRELMLVREMQRRRREAEPGESPGENSSSPAKVH